MKKNQWKKKDTQLNVNEEGEEENEKKKKKKRIKMNKKKWREMNEKNTCRKM